MESIQTRTTTKYYYFSLNAMDFSFNSKEILEWTACEERTAQTRSPRSVYLSMQGAALVLCEQWLCTSHVLCLPPRQPPGCLLAQARGRVAGCGWHQASVWPRVGGHHSGRDCCSVNEASGTSRLSLPAAHDTRFTDYSPRWPVGNNPNLESGI